MKYNSIYRILLKLLVIAFLSIGCRKKKEASENTDIRSVTFTYSNNISANYALIDNKNSRIIIHPDFYNGIDPDQFRLSFQLADKAVASINPDDILDLSKPIKFTVKAENGNTKQYTI